MAGPLDSAAVKAAARRAGFSKCGIACAEPLDPAPLDRVLARGGEADMVWLRTQRAERLDPARLLPGARSVVALALAYGAAAGDPAPPPGAGEVARYARGRDYHAVVKKKLKALAAGIAEVDPDARVLATADVAPVMEKAWAQRAGIGWVGKNGCLITPEHGSWVVLATALLDRELEPDPPHPERCGSCDACLPACPTGAIPEPGLVDARRCISFWTIERRGPIPGDVAGGLGRWMFGCDDCQTACPWNRAGAVAGDPGLAPRPEQAALGIDDLLALTEDEYRRRFWGTALARARYDGLVRNAVLAAGRSGDRRYRAAVAALAGSPHEAVREAARWAVARLG
ncbi:tRNA epoxyqueuosine(34) reductase QueG [Anaeromyxobacter oryzae]|uniref:Epoxyqueuosine reductase n=1 Tax=Anaeromyxobacter oryzae TaxID=2918170 RepID=A0ABM7X1X6_9BACT|nr:tRNA epoxyqueuosine(34) reductase QueG [Anaeromyxobacter oryzae]BDG05780.1 epoxyqueuosine reductase [Anaeromyxobacter oryzae]